MKHSPLVIWFLLALIVTPASAHHSLAAYETSGYRTIEGTAKEFFWGNPHTNLILITEEAPGEFTEWVFEGGSPGRLHVADSAKTPLFREIKLRLLTIATEIIRLADSSSQ